MRSGLLLLPILVLSACGERQAVNPPTQPAQPIESGDAPAPPDLGTASILPGRGAASFVGRWAAEVAWCAAPQTDRRPIELTPTRFEGYENSCAITRIEEVADGYIAALACESEKVARAERVRFQVTGDVLRLTYLDQASDPVTLRKCTTLQETATDPAGAP